MPKVWRLSAEIAARKAAKQKAVQPAQSASEPPEILFADGKAVIRPHTNVVMPVSIMRLTFQDGETVDIPSNLEFVGLERKDSAVAAYDAFLKTQVEMHGLKGPTPPLNSKFWQDLGLSKGDD